MTTEIKICMGSACFAKGNQENLEYIKEYIEENNLENKDIYIFVTSGGSSVEGSFNDLKNIYPNLRFIRGIKFDSNVDDEEIKSFINK